MIQPLLIIIGTRPEGIKMLPVYFALKKAGLPVLLCSTMQHSELLQEVFDLFGVVPDFKLDIMKPDQDLFYLTQTALMRLRDVLQEIHPSLVFVHGDTTTTMAASLAAFYLSIPVAHVEAGLRTHDLQAPFPEEMNRRVAGMVGTYHFAPTALATANLMAEGVAPSRIFCVGNTVVDALRIMKEKITSDTILPDPALQKLVTRLQRAHKKIFLLTTHRRESFDGGIARTLATVKQFLQDFPETFCIYPYHPNPHVIQAIEQADLHSIPNLYLSKPLSFKDLVFLELSVDWVATDSGGIQEEAVSLGKQVLILREKTERIEGVWAGLAHLVGTDSAAILRHLTSCLEMSHSSPSSQGSTVYGDGYAADHIARIVQTLPECAGSSLVPPMYHPLPKEKDM